MVFAFFCDAVARARKSLDPSYFSTIHRRVKRSLVVWATRSPCTTASTFSIRCHGSVAGRRDHGTTYVAPLKRFEETEKALLKPLPAVAPELATWAQVKLHGDCHLQVHKCRYSASYKLVGQTLDVRLSEPRWLTPVRLQAGV